MACFLFSLAFFFVCVLKSLIKRSRRPFFVERVAFVAHRGYQDCCSNRCALHAPKT